MRAHAYARAKVHVSGEEGAAAVARQHASAESPVPILNPRASPTLERGLLEGCSGVVFPTRVCLPCAEVMHVCYVLLAFVG